MLGWIILAFIVMPFVELYLLIEIGQRIGLWPTFGIVIGTGLLGGVLARWQGIRAWRDVIGAFREGRTPTTELVAGALFLVGAALLLTPGVLTDAFGFAMMVPVLRRTTARYLIRRVKDSDRVQAHVSVGGQGAGGAFGWSGRTGPGVGADQNARQTHDMETTGYTKEDETTDGDEDRGGDDGEGRR